MLPYAGVDTTRLLVEAMKVTDANSRVIANNIANVDTPRYNATNLDFQATLRNAIEGRGRVSLRKTQNRHFVVEFSRPEVEANAFISKNDFNKVDLDEQMAKLSENTGRYTLYGSLLVKRFQLLRSMFSSLR